ITTFLGSLLLSVLNLLLYSERTFESSSMIIAFWFLIFTPLAFLIIFDRLSLLSPSLFISLSIVLYEIPKVTIYSYFTTSSLNPERSFIYTNDVNFDAVINYQLFTLAFVFILFISEIVIKEAIFVTQKSSLIKHENIFYFSKYLSYFSLAALAVITVYFLVSSGFNPLFYLLRRSNSLFYSDNRFPYFLFMLINFILFISPLLRLYSVRLWVGVLLLSGLLSYLTTGSRGFLIYAILANIIAYIYDTKKLPTFRVFIIGLIIISSFSVLGALRRNADTLDWSSIYSSSDSSSLSDYQAQMRDEVIFSNIGHINDEFYLRTITMPIFSFIPRELIGELKPVMIDGLVAQEIFGRFNVGFPVNISTEVFLNFGFFGVLYASFLVMISLILQTWCVNRGVINIYISFMVLSQTFLSSKLVFSVQSLLMFFLLYAFFLKIDLRLKLK
ncbi:oligosaccharide repeat unit polymerase, partial [Vibrio alginolyticus]|uniref:O-antigen polymerase n=2 Tax=Vibrio TaxID=662 RepID=UPI00215D0D5A